MNKVAVASIIITSLGAPVLAAADYTYLALGDSVPFGMNVTLLPPYTQHTPKPSDFVGYPEAVALAVGVTELNASCPGETSGSFLDINVPDNGCNSPHVVPLPSPSLPPVTIPPFKTTIGLHTNYIGPQMDFAIAQLKANKRIDLVSLNIGANDVLLVLPALAQCGPDITCANGVLGPVLNTYAANLAQILIRIRAAYQGTLILMTYYSPSPELDGVTLAVNSVMTGVAAQLSTSPGFAPITIADGFTAFQTASAPPAHDSCQAGLLIQLPPSPYNLSPCDIHPSPLGRDLLADLVELAAPPASTACNGTYSGTFVGNLTVSAGQVCIFTGGGVTGNVTQTGGTLIFSGITVGGNVQIQGGGTFSLGAFARINGNLQIQNLPSNATQNQICGVRVGGNLTYQNNLAPVSIGAATMCAGNTVGGDLQVGNDSATVNITGNTVTGNLQIQGDTGSTTVVSNVIAHNLQCSGNTSITGSQNAALQKQGQCAAF
jgi:lysophospholipase L1-like esterase